MAYTAHSGDFGLSGDRMAPVANGIGARLARASSPSERRPRRAAAAGGRPGDCPAPGALRRTHHGQHGARNDGEGSGVRLETAAVAASSSPKRTLSLRITPMVYARLHDHFVERAPHARTNESALYPGPSEPLTLRANGTPDSRLVLRPVRSSDGEALQNYVRGLSPRSRYNRFLGAASELPASELARALAANGRDTLTLLLTSTVAGSRNGRRRGPGGAFLRRTRGRIRHVDCR